MARIHKISGYLVDANGYCSGDDIKIQLEERGLDLMSQHLHIETVDVGEWEDSNPLNFKNCDLAECERYFKFCVAPFEQDREVKPGQIWKHFKTGKLVKVMAVSQDTENVGNYCVVYEYDGKVWHRPLMMFLSEVDHKKYPDAKQKYRFELVSQ